MDSKKETAKLVARIRLANFMELPEGKYQRITKGVEKSNLFKKLSCFDDFNLWSQNRVIFFKKFARTNIIGDQEPHSPDTIAKFQRDKKGFVIGYFSPHYTREYIINRKNFRRLKARGKLKHSEVEKMEKLFRKIRLIDTRKGLIHQILRQAVQYQRHYLETEMPRDLKPFTLLELSKQTGIDIGLISRAVKGKKIKLPSGKEVSLRALFPQEKEVRDRCIEEIILREREDYCLGVISRTYSDDELIEKLNQIYKLGASRRVVAKSREGLDIPFSGNRLSQYMTEEERSKVRPKILAVDDEHIFRELFAIMMDKEGHRAKTAQNGAEAIGLIKKEDSIRLVFLDVRMPRMNGLETYKQIKRLRPNVKVVMITGFGMEVSDLVEEALRLGALGCLRKPFGTKEVTKIVNEVCPK